MPSRLPSEKSRRFRSLFLAAEHNPSAIVITDAAGRIEYVNPRFEELTGYAAEDVLGKTPRVLQSGLHDRGFYEELWGTLARGEVWKGEFCNRRKTGELYWESAAIAPVRDRKGVVANYVAVKEDVTESKVLREELLRAKEDAETANEAKSVFLASMSHEIRTPMNGILGMLELLRQTDLDPQQEEYLRIVRESAQTLMHFLNQILEYSRLQANRTELESLDFDLMCTVGPLFELFALRAREKGLETVLDLDPQVPPRVRGDPLRLRQILTNLLDNALKFTEKGWIALSLRRLPPEDGGLWLEFGVVDTGIGIPGEKRHRIFQGFGQLDRSTTRRYGGSGLGLAIVRQMVSLWGGFLSLESEEGKGSSFHVRLPFLPAGPAPSREALEEGEGGILPDPPLPLRLDALLVEGHPVSQRLVAALFARRGWNLDLVPGGEEALEAVREKDYDLILLDVDLPGMDGLETVRRLRRRLKRPRPVPLVALTAQDLPEERERGLEAGFDAWVTKPLRVRELLVVLSRLLTGDPEGEVVDREADPGDRG